MSAARTCAECGARLDPRNRFGLCNSHSMKARHADPEFAAARDARMCAINADPEIAARRRAARKARYADPEFAARSRAESRERLRALNADPEFSARNRERGRARMKALQADPSFNPLAALSPEERADYDVLKKAGYSRQYALLSIGRADLAPEGGA